MKKLTGSFPVKFGAWVLYVLSLFGASLSAAVVLTSFFIGFYNVPTGVSYSAAIQEMEPEMEQFFSEYVLFRNVFRMRWWSVALLILLLIVALTLFVFVICGAGKKGEREGQLTFFDRIPLDVTLIIVLFLACMLLSVCIEGVDYHLFYDLESSVLGVLCLCFLATALGVLLLYFCRTFAVRIKVGRWWRNTVCCWIARMLCVIFRTFWRQNKAVWRWFLRLFHAIPVAWRSALAAAAALLVEIPLSYEAIGDHTWGAGVLLFAVDFIILSAVILSTYQIALLKEGGEKLAAGDLTFTVDTRHMFWDFRQHGENLNSIAVGMSVAVDERMRSERLKTELITNVSHDIKTPLTNIVNYIDLMQREKDPEKQREYLEVLSRQAARLKKLTVDLVEASKASTGALTVELVPTDVGELINQALGEYGEKLAVGGLTPVVTQPEEPVTVLADGRHLWRVLDNLLNNAVKYAQAGTRLYIDVTSTKAEVVISMKNISRDRLNISEEELMERFVRGDSSRHTEGSGLGLSIARSLTELMGGKFTITIDGDLFKAEICLVASYTRRDEED